MDLTKIDQPFGTLDIETKLALHRAHYEGEVIEFKIFGSEWHPLPCPESNGLVREGFYRLSPEPLRDIILPWAALDARWQWAARDKSGSVWVYAGYPNLAESYEVTDLFANFDPGNKPWNESLVRRPEGL